MYHYTRIAGMTPHKDLVAATSVPLVLAILHEGDSYGYEILQKVATLSDGAWTWSEGMLYPILHKLEKAGHISSYWKKAAGQRRRRYYHLEDLGSLELVDRMNAWRSVDAILARACPDLPSQES